MEKGRSRTPAVVLCALVMLLVPVFRGGAGRAEAADKPSVKLSEAQAGTGGSLTVTGRGWRPKTLLMILICGQAEPSRGVPGGTNSCANSDGRAATADAEGRFSRKLPVAEPPVPCPCVVHVSTITGEKAEADVVFQVAGHSVEPLPEETGAGRLSVLTDTRLRGSSGLLTWFGAPPARELVFTVGNVGTAPVKDPLFQVGTSHGVFAPKWEEQQWRGTIEPGRKARITMPVELAAGAHGDYSVSLKYGGEVLAERPWDVGRPWGVTLFWLMLCVVVPAALFRVGMAVVDRVRPGRTTTARRRRGPRLPRLGLPTRKSDPADTSRTGPADAEPRTARTLPWFSPGTDPRATAGQLSAPQEEDPTSPTPPTTPTGKGTT